jgi:acetyl-CoA synthetase
VRATLSDLVAVANPLDYHTFVWAKEAAMTETFGAMVGCGFDLSLLVLDFPRSDRCSDADWDVAVRAIVAAAEQTDARAAVLATLPENMPESRAADLIARGIAPLCGIEEGLAAAEAAAFVGRSWSRPPPPPLLIGALARQAPRTLDEAEAKAALAASGLTVPEGRIASEPRAAAAVAEAVGFPVAVKAVGIAHKTEAGAVRLDLESAAAVELAATELAPLGMTLLVEKMVSDAVAELLVGVTRDPELGLLMTVGAGGVSAEVLGDTVSLLLPATLAEIRSAILSLRTAPLLLGYRNRPLADLDAAVASALAIARYAEANVDTLEELDVNPLLVRPEGRGAVAVDALIRVRDK